jgi:hypothetical protein
MPRKKLELLPGREERREDCFAFYIDKTGEPKCRALTDVYCLKEHTPCKFRATPETAFEAKRKARLRLARIGRL